MVFNVSKKKVAVSISDMNILMGIKVDLSEARPAVKQLDSKGQETVLKENEYGGLVYQIPLLQHVGSRR